MSIAGSDSGGGAGIQADLQTFAALGVHGTCAITCLTAQNPCGVTGIQASSPDILRKQIDAVLAELKPAAVKTGIRSATGEWVLIVDGDGQHPPEDAARLIARLGEYDLVIGARDARTQATARPADRSSVSRSVRTLSSVRKSVGTADVPATVGNSAAAV